MREGAAGVEGNGVGEGGGCQTGGTRATMKNGLSDAWWVALGLRKAVSFLAP